MRALQPDAAINSCSAAPGWSWITFRREAWLRALLASLSFVLVFGTTGLIAQTLRYSKPLDAKNGERIYKNGCIACHGATGKGAPMTSTEFKRPNTFPDFSNCSQTTPEPDIAWKAVVVYGGPSRGFSQIMPSFGELLSSPEIDDVIAYMRGFCTEKGWPRGELNLPRALVTEKAFPEKEFVVSTAVNGSGAPGFTTDFIHEQSFGKKNQLEVDVPWDMQDQNHNWNSGIGDITFGVKRVMFSSLRTGSILALQAGILPPTGNSKRGFGAGTTTFEPFASFDQLFPTNTFLQFQMGADIPFNQKVSPQSLFGYATLGQTLAGQHRLGREWSPMVEFLTTRDLTGIGKTDLDVLPEMQVTLSRRQHVRADVGVRAPVTNTADRTPQVIFYVLWDWADGKLWKGW
jgi:mono/diheme cytochrome c family protein